MEFDQRQNMIVERFITLFNRPPSVWGRAPGRVDLMGSHTDYNLGYVMTMTIDRDTWIAACPRSDRQVQAYSLNLDGGSIFNLDHIHHDSTTPWANYLRGMAKTLQDAGYPLVGLDMLVHSTIPFGSGLSSSAAIEMAAGIVFQATGGFRLEPVRMALLGQRAENQFVGVNCGILDQYSSALGQAGCSLLLDCRSLTSQISSIADGIQVVICDTKAKRSLVGSEYGERRAQCEEGARILGQFIPNVEALRDVTLEQFHQHRAALPPVVAKRCQFIIEENQRVLDLAHALSSGDRTGLRALFAASYAGASNLYEIGAPAMEAMITATLGAPGVIAARQAGAGFGGCMVALVENTQVEAFQRNVTRHYQALTGIAPSVYAVSASAGAGLVIRGA